MGNHKEFPVSLKIGRQELSYGDERLVGAFAWNNIGRVFDSARVRWQDWVLGSVDGHVVLKMAPHGIDLDVSLPALGKATWRAAPGISTSSTSLATSRTATSF